MHASRPTFTPKIAFACPERWEEMRADGPQRRFCEQCQLHVHDLSSMSRPEGEQFLASGDGRSVCISFVTRPDGTIVTRTPWDGMKRRWNATRSWVFALLAILAPLAGISCGSQRDDKLSRTGGSICVAPDDGKDGPAKQDEQPPLGRTAGTPLQVTKP